MDLLHSLDIGSSSVKLITLRKERNELFLFEHQELDLPPETLVTRQGKSMLKNPDAMEKQIAAVLSTSKTKNKEVAVTLPDHCATILFKEIDKLFDDKMKQDYVRWRLRKILASSLVTNSLLDYQILGRKETDDGVNFYVVVEIIKEQLLNNLASIIFNAGFTPLYFDINSFGLANLYHEYLDRYPEKTNNYMIINIGHGATTFAFYRDKILSYLRTIPIGGMHFTAKISILKETDLAGAEKIKRETNFFSGKTMDMENIEKVFGPWLKELDVTIQFYNKTNLVGRMEKIFLGGGSSLIEQFDDFLFRVTGIKAELLPLDNIIGAGKGQLESRQLTATLGAAVGTLFREGSAL